MLELLLYGGLPAGIFLKNFPCRNFCGNVHPLQLPRFLMVRPLSGFAIFRRAGGNLYKKSDFCVLAAVATDQQTYAMGAESKKNLKRKRQALDVNKEEESKRANYYKTLRREQKKQRREKKNEIPQRHMAPKAKQKVGFAVKPVDKGKAKSTEYLSRGKQILSAALAQAAQPKETSQATETTLKRKMATLKKASIARDLKEVDPANVVRERGSKSIGSGTFGTCFLGHYRGIEVVIKEYNDRHKDAESNHLRLRQEAAYEARVIEKLEDNPGIPLLFGAMVKQKPVSLVTKLLISKPQPRVCYR